MAFHFLPQVQWIFQSNLLAKDDLLQLNAACQDLKIHYENVQVIPFLDELPMFSQPTSVENIYYGSTTFIQNVYRKLQHPLGIFYDEATFTMSCHRNAWKHFMLNNAPAAIMSFDDLVKQKRIPEGEWFIRPDDDSKCFEGQVMTFSEIQEWWKRIVQLKDVEAGVQPNTRILVGPPYQINKEWRVLVVERKVVTVSQYRENMRLKVSSENIPTEVIDFVEDRCKEYVPHDIFIMDVGFCGSDYCIIECNNVNSCGFYAMNPHAIIDSLTNYVRGKLQKLL